MHDQEVHEADTLSISTISSHVSASSRVSEHRSSSPLSLEHRPEPPLLHESDRIRATNSLQSLSPLPRRVQPELIALTINKPRISSSSAVSSSPTALGFALEQVFENVRKLFNLFRHRNSSKYEMNNIMAVTLHSMCFS